MKNFNKNTKNEVENAINTAISALLYLIKHEEPFHGFVQSSGVDIGEIRSLAKEKGFLAAVLDFYLNDEALMLIFCEEERIKPATLQRAAHLLGGGIWERDIP